MADSDLDEVLYIDGILIRCTDIVNKSVDSERSIERASATSQPTRQPKSERNIPGSTEVRWIFDLL